MTEYLSTLRLCTKETFNKAVLPFRKNEIAFPQWFVENIKKGEGVCSRGAYDCTIPTFANAGQYGVQQHLCPNDETLGKLNLGNNLLLKKIDDEKEYINGLLIGGINAKNSLIVQNSIKNFCENNNIPHSKLLGQINTIGNSGSDVAYKAFSDEYLLASKEIDVFLEKNRQRFLQMPKEEVRAEVEKFLNRHYQEVDINKLDLTV